MTINTPAGRTFKIDDDNNHPHVAQMLAINPTLLDEMCDKRGLDPRPGDQLCWPVVPDVHPPVVLLVEFVGGIMPPLSRRLRSLCVLPQYVIQLRGMFEVITKMPDDAKITEVHFDPMRLGWVLFIQSREFAPVPDGEVVPPLDALVYRFIDPKTITERKD